MEFSFIKATFLFTQTSLFVFFADLETLGLFLRVPELLHVTVGVVIDVM